MNIKKYYTGKRQELYEKPEMRSIFLKTRIKQKKILKMHQNSHKKNKKYDEIPGTKYDKIPKDKEYDEIPWDDAQNIEQHKCLSIKRRSEFFFYFIFY